MVGEGGQCGCCSKLSDTMHCRSTCAGVSWIAYWARVDVCQYGCGGFRQVHGGKCGACACRLGGLQRK